MTEVVEILSGGNLFVMLGLTAVICLILGMGLPTTANYIVVATLMAPVIVQLSATSDVAVPLIAAHLFVFYFGLMADVTPPVGLASFAASAISGASPLATGVQAFRYEIRTGILPFVFIFNHQLLLIDIGNVAHGVTVIAATIAGMLIFVAATQHWFLVRSRIWETAVLLVACFTLFRPGFFMDFVEPPYEILPASAIMTAVDATQPGAVLRLRVAGINLRGDTVERVVALRLDATGEAEARLEAAGLAVGERDGRTVIDDIRFSSEAEKLGLDFGDEILSVEIASGRPPKELFYLLGPALTGLVFWSQKRRRDAAAPVTP
jgi:hypothetical protein